MWARYGGHGEPGGSIHATSYKRLHYREHFLLQLIWLCPNPKWRSSKKQLKIQVIPRTNERSSQLWSPEAVLISAGQWSTDEWTRMALRLHLHWTLFSLSKECSLFRNNVLFTGVVKRTSLAIFFFVVQLIHRPKAGQKSAVKQCREWWPACSFCYSSFIKHPW